MSKSTGLAVFASLVVCASFVFAGLEFRRMGQSFHAMEERVAKVEAASGANAEPSATGTENASRTPATLAGVAGEIDKLRDEVVRLRESREAEPAAGGPSPAPDTTGGASGGAKKADAAEVAKAVTEALAAEKKAEKEKQARQYKKQMEASAKQWAAQLGKKLELTEQHKEKIAEIFAEQWTKGSAGWYGQEADENAEPVDWEKLQKETNEKVKAHLTPEQGQKYDEMMKKQNWWGGDGEGNSESTDQ